MKKIKRPPPEPKGRIPVKTISNINVKPPNVEALFGAHVDDDDEEGEDGSAIPFQKLDPVFPEGYTPFSHDRFKGRFGPSDSDQKNMQDSQVNQTLKACTDILDKVITVQASNYQGLPEIVENQRKITKLLEILVMNAQSGNTGFSQAVAKGWDEANLNDPVTIIIGPHNPDSKTKNYKTLQDFLTDLVTC